MRKFRRNILMLVGISAVLGLTACGDADDVTGVETEVASEVATITDNGAGNELENAESKITSIPEFTSVDLDGNTVSSDLIKEKDISVINIWGTFCGPCIEEMPELASWNKELSDNVQIIGIVTDADKNATDTIEEAKDILEAAGADFTNIVTSEDMKSLLNNIVYVPTTIIVDKDYNVVDVVVGADVESYKEAVEKALAN